MLNTVSEKLNTSQQFRVGIHVLQEDKLKTLTA